MSQRAREGQFVRLRDTLYTYTVHARLAENSSRIGMRRLRNIRLTSIAYDKYFQCSLHLEHQASTMANCMFQHFGFQKESIWNEG